MNHDDDDDDDNDDPGPTLVTSRNITSRSTSTVHQSKTKGTSRYLLS